MFTTQPTWICKRVYAQENLLRCNDRENCVSASSVTVLGLSIYCPKNARHHNNLMSRNLTNLQYVYVSRCIYVCFFVSSCAAVEDEAMPLGTTCSPRGLQLLCLMPKSREPFPVQVRWTLVLWCTFMRGH